MRKIASNCDCGQTLLWKSFVRTQSLFGSRIFNHIFVSCPALSHLFPTSFLFYFSYPSFTHFLNPPPSVRSGIRFQRLQFVGIQSESMCVMWIRFRSIIDGSKSVWPFLDSLFILKRQNVYGMYLKKKKKKNHVTQIKHFISAFDFKWRTLRKWTYGYAFSSKCVLAISMLWLSIDRKTQVTSFTPIPFHFPIS